MVRRLGPPVALLGLALLGACDETFGPYTELEANRARWSAAGPPSYTYRLQISCFCLPEFVQPVRITVRDGAITEIASGITDIPLPPAEAARFQITIDSLFDWLHAATGGMAQQVRVTYDQALGYPRDAWIDYSLQVADDEIGFAAALETP